MKIEDIEEKVRSYRWLKDIADNYRNMIATMEREKDCFRLYKFAYATRGDTEVFDINPHRSIPVSYLQAGINDALRGIEDEMRQLASELNKINIEL